MKFAVRAGAGVRAADPDRLSTLIAFEAVAFGGLVFYSTFLGPQTA
jgi:hypothetical protein